MKKKKQEQKIKTAKELRQEIRDRFAKNPRLPIFYSKKILPLEYCSFEYFKEQFFEKLKTQGNSKEEVIEYFMNSWVLPIVNNEEGLNWYHILYKKFQNLYDDPAIRVVQPSDKNEQPREIELESEKDKMIVEVVKELKAFLNDFHINGKSNTNLANNENSLKLSLRQIALVHAYNNKQITRTNGNKIAESHGFKSGEKLFQHYTFYSSPVNRKANESSITKLKNKITLFESVLSYLKPKRKTLAEEEISKLYGYIEQI